MKYILEINVILIKGKICRMESYSLNSGDFDFDANTNSGFIYSTYELGKQGKWD